MDVKMEKFTLLAVFCFVFVYSSFTKAEVLEISPSVYSARLNPSWTIAKPVGAKKAEQFQNLVNLLMKLPKPAKSEGLSGYDGFVIKHVLDSGETHPIEVARCSFPILETALLETAPLDINPKILSKEARKNIRNTIVACPQAPPKKPKTKSVA